MGRLHPAFAGDHMIFLETPLQGAYLISVEPICDERGYFARTFCREEFILHGLNPDIMQSNVSYNKRPGTLRGMHYQSAPYAESKLIQCLQGSVYDVIIDLRPDSPTYTQWFAATLTDSSRTLLYVPEGLAHGFQTLSEDTILSYQMGRRFQPGLGAGIRWNDPYFEITWPMTPTVISERDQQYPDFETALGG